MVFFLLLVAQKITAIPYAPFWPKKSSKTEGKDLARSYLQYGVGINEVFCENFDSKGGLLAEDEEML